MRNIIPEMSKNAKPGNKIITLKGKVNVKTTKVIASNKNKVETEVVSLMQKS
jgi:hypothetical protein